MQPGLISISGDSGVQPLRRTPSPVFAFLTHVSYRDSIFKRSCFATLCCSGNDVSNFGWHRGAPNPSPALKGLPVLRMREGVASRSSCFTYSGFQLGFTVLIMHGCDLIYILLLGTFFFPHQQPLTRASQEMSGVTKTLEGVSEQMRTGSHRCPWGCAQTFSEYEKSSPAPLKGSPACPLPAVLSSPLGTHTG